MLKVNDKAYILLINNRNKYTVSSCRIEKVNPNINSYGVSYFSPGKGYIKVNLPSKNVYETLSLANSICKEFNSWGGY